VSDVGYFDGEMDDFTGLGDGKALTICFHLNNAG